MKKEKWLLMFCLGFWSCRGALLPGRLTEEQQREKLAREIGFDPTTRHILERNRREGSKIFASVISQVSQFIRRPFGYEV